MRAYYRGLQPMRGRRAKDPRADQTDVCVCVRVLTTMKRAAGKLCSRSLINRIGEGRQVAACYDRRPMNFGWTDSLVSVRTRPLVPCPVFVNLTRMPSTFSFRFCFAAAARDVVRTSVRLHFPDRALIAGSRTSRTFTGRRICCILRSCVGSNSVGVVDGERTVRTREFVAL